MAGFVIETGNYIDDGSFEDFQNKIITKTDINQSNADELVYTASDNTILDIDYNSNESQAEWIIDEELFDLNIENFILYNGPNLKINNNILHIEDDNSVYEVNFRNEIPVFTEFSK